MTPAKLQSDLAAELSKILDHLRFPDSNGEMTKIKIYQQSLPAGEESTLYPYLTVRLLTAKLTKDAEYHKVKVYLDIGVYDDDVKANGHEYILNIIQDIQDRFFKNPLLNQNFVMDDKFRWRLERKAMHPYYRGRVKTTWIIPMSGRENRYS